jgi:hypothetical protein
MFYNTNFDVKYFDIYKELTEKKGKEKEIHENDCEYSFDDITDICSKLYIDEYASVFNAEDVLDDKIDIGLRKLLELMKENKDFVSFLGEIHEKIFGSNKELNDHDHVDVEKEKEYYIFLSLFNYDTFYLVHKIICSQIKTSSVSNDMLNDLRQIMKKSIENNI